MTEETTGGSTVDEPVVMDSMAEPTEGDATVTVIG